MGREKMKKEIIGRSRKRIRITPPTPRITSPMPSPGQVRGRTLR